MGKDKEVVTMGRMAPHAAAERLVGMAVADPRGLMRPDDIQTMCEAGECFELAGAVDAVYVVRVRNGVMWIDAAKGAGDADVTALIARITESQARAAGLRAMGMQTARPGLVKKAKRHGWRVTGWVMQKDVT